LAQPAAGTTVLPRAAPRSASHAVTRSRRAARWPLLIAFLGVSLLAVMVAGVAWGPSPVPPATVAGVVARHLGLPVPVAWPATQDAIVWQLRLPRVVAGALVGAALATSGALFQGLFRNPMADPYVLGISSGAAFGATVALALPVLVLTPNAAPGALWAGLDGSGIVPLCAFAGALGAAALVASLARRGARLPVADLLLAGFATAAVLGAATTFLLVMSDRLLLRLRSVFAWMVGGIAVGGWGQLALAAPLILLGVLAALALARWLDAFLLGEEGAATVGVPVEGAKTAVVAVGALLTAAAVTLSGLVGFVGLLVPHAVRLVAGPANVRLIPAAALGGAAFLVLADLLARTVLAPVEVPVGVLTALTGGPVFLVLLKRSRTMRPRR
jgi:iron complex transport system permease protein